MDLLGRDQADHTVPDEVPELPLPRLEHLLVGREGPRIALRQGHLLTGASAPALVEGELQRRGEADRAGGRPLEGLAGVGHDAAAVVPVPRVDRVVAEVREHLIAGPIAVDGREAAARRDQLRHGLHERGRTVRLDAAAERGLVRHDRPGRLDRQIGDLVRPVRAVHLGAADREVLEVRVPREEARRVLRDRPGPLAVLEPEQLDQLQRRVPRDPPRLQVALMVGEHVLVEAAGVPRERVLGEDPAELDEPHELDRLAEGLRGLLRDDVAERGDFQELGPPLLVRLRLRHGARLLGVAAAETDHPVADEDDGPVEVPLPPVRGDGGVQGRQVGLGLPTDAAEALRQELIDVVRRDLPDAVAPLGIGVEEARVHADALRVLGDP